MIESRKEEWMEGKVGRKKRKQEERKDRAVSCMI